MQVWMMTVILSAGWLAFALIERPFYLFSFIKVPLMTSVVLGLADCKEEEKAYFDLTANDW